MTMMVVVVVVVMMMKKMKNIFFINWQVPLVIRAVNLKLCHAGIQITKVIIAPSFITLWQFAVLISLVDIQITGILWRVPFTIFWVRPLWTAYTHVPVIINTQNSQMLNMYSCSLLHFLQTEHMSVWKVLVSCSSSSLSSFSSV
jgi:hypothetical protein